MKIYEIILYNISWGFIIWVGDVRVIFGGYGGFSILKFCVFVFIVV